MVLGHIANSAFKLAASRWMHERAHQIQVALSKASVLTNARYSLKGAWKGLLFRSLELHPLPSSV